jgi:hypothetical protein
MEEQDVRARAEAMCAALVSGDIGQATTDFSDELRRNLGEVIALLPLPATGASVESIERGGTSAFVVVLELVSESETVQVQTRWKERDGRPTVIEASHLSRVELAPPPGDEDADGEAPGDAPA